MSLPRVSVLAAAGEAPTVTVDGNPLPGVRSAQITVTRDGVPQVSIVLAADQVDVALPAGVTVLRAGPSAAEFAASLSPARLERAALEHDDCTVGEGFVAAVTAAARQFDDDRRD